MTKDAGTDEGTMIPNSRSSLNNCKKTRNTINTRNNNRNYLSVGNITRHLNSCVGRRTEKN